MITLKNRKVRLLATKLYIFTIKDKSGGLPFSSIEIQIKRSQGQSIEQARDCYSRNFYRYANGKSCIKKLEIIESFEKIELYIGCKKVLDNPLWLILDNPLATLDDIHGLMQLLPADIKQRLFSYNKNTAVYERKKWSSTRHFSRIGRQNNLDALACLLMLIREMEITQDWHRYVEAKWQTQYIILRLVHFQPIIEIADDLDRKRVV